MLFRSFSQSRDKAAVERPPIIEYVSTDSPPDVMACALIALVVAGPLVSLLRLRRRAGTELPPIE